MGANYRFSFAKTSFGKLHWIFSRRNREPWLQLERGQLVTHSITRGQLSIGHCVLLTLRLVSLILPSALHCIFRGLLRLTVKVRWAYKSYIYWHTNSWHRLLALDDGNKYFSIFLFPPNRSDKEWQLCTTEGPTPVFKGFGGKGRAIDGRNIYFLFSYFSPKHEWHLWSTIQHVQNGTYCNVTICRLPVDVVG